MRTPEEILHAWAELVSRRRPLLLAVVALVCGAVAIQAANVEAEFSPQALFADLPDARDLSEETKAIYGSEENALLLLVRSPSLFSPEVATWLRDLTPALESLDFVERVQNPATLELPRNPDGDVMVVDAPLGDGSVTEVEVDAWRDALQRTPFLHGLSVQPDRGAVLVAIYLPRDQASLRYVAPWVHTLMRTVAARPPPPDVELSWGGMPHIRTHAIEKLIRDQFVLIPLAAFINVIFLLLAFRWLPGVVLPLLSVGMATAMLVGGMAMLGVHFNLVNNVLPTLILVIGISDAIHVLSRYREMLLGGRTHHDAIAAAMRSMTVACLFTSLTTSIGFASLLLSQTGILRGFGATAALGVLLAWVVTITLLPLSLAFCKPMLVHRPAVFDQRLDQLIEQLFLGVLRHPRAVFATTLVLVTAALVSSTQVRIDSRLMEIFSSEDPVYAVTKKLEEDFGGVLSMQVLIDTGVPGAFDHPEHLDRARAFEEALGTLDSVLAVQSYAGWLDEIHVAFTGRDEVRGTPFLSQQRIASLRSLVEGSSDDLFAPYLNPDRSGMRIILRIPDDGGRAILARLAAIEDLAQTHYAAFEGTRVRVTGDAVLGARGLSVLIWDLITSIGTALLIIFAFLLALFRNFRLGLLAFPPNVLPLVLTLGWMGWRGIELNSTTLIIFSVSLGLAVDNTIHVVRRFQEEMLGGASRDDALRGAVLGTGRAVVVSSMVLLAGLSVVLASSFVPIRLFAELTALTIFSCLVGDLVLLPVLLHLFWHPKDTKALHAQGSE